MSFETKPVGPTPVFVSPYGKQGKLKAVYCFHARKITKIITAATLAELRADPHYAVNGSH